MKGATQAGMIAGILLGCAVASGLYVVLVWWLDRTPGPKGLPFLGNTLELLRNWPRFLDYLRDCNDKYGKVGPAVWNLWESVVPCSPAALFGFTPMRPSSGTVAPGARRSAPARADLAFWASQLAPTSPWPGVPIWPAGGFLRLHGC